MGFCANSDEEPLKSFKRESGVRLADVLELNKNKDKESNCKTKQNYFNSPNER